MAERTGQPDAEPEPTVVDVVDGTGRLRGPAATWLTDHARAAVASLGHRAGGDVRVRVVGDDEMAQAHWQFSRVRGTTDVLTFDLSEGGAAAGGAPLDVDVLVCIDEAARQAAVRGHAVERELLLYVVHAVLHCLGEDDTTDEAAARMHAREDAVLSAIGVGVVYAAPEVGAKGEGS